MKVFLIQIQKRIWIVRVEINSEIDRCLQKVVDFPTKEEQVQDFLLCLILERMSMVDQDKMFFF